MLLAFPPAGGSEAVFSEIFGLSGDCEPRLLRYPLDQQSILNCVEAPENRASGRAVVLVGASLGAVAAIETAQFLEKRGITVTCTVVLSAVAPHRRVVSPVRQWTDGDLLDLVRDASGGVPPSFSSPEIRSYAFGLLRRDLEWGQSHPGLPRIPLRSPLVAIRGERDTLVPEQAGTSDWAQWTVSDFSSWTVSGGKHFFFGDPDGARSVARAMRSFRVPADVAEEASWSYASRS
ncbi:thioesterase II family protein [Amycolatopsis sp. WQ 127309]|uniref:thioesterase II family protein n=1 Tax=Amycolatopsis sp. WQ 127309 TaxID=2932773 RepID=UPI001FF191FE|nr:alpha/beta fold hydrolase [Amycolatopsis sp. WQ 127309]UOZ06908.1 alpha/beta fold hydrolase [Amycolatopsis sp. WQ 127309]